MATSPSLLCSKFQPYSKDFQDLLEAYRNVKRFQITKQRDLKAGLVVNVRNTLALKNSLVEYIQVNGVPTVRKAGLTSFHWKSYVFRSARLIRMHGSAVSFIAHNPYRVWKANNKTELGGIHVDTLIGYNIAFKYNAKVINFVNQLLAAPRFYQHCIIENVPYNRETFDSFQAELFDRQNGCL